MSPFGDLAAQRRREKDEEGADLFSFPSYNVPGDGIEQRHRTLHGLPESVFEGIEVLTDRRFYFIKCVQKELIESVKVIKTCLFFRISTGKIGILHTYLLPCPDFFLMRLFLVL